LAHGGFVDRRGLLDGMNTPSSVLDALSASRYDDNTLPMAASSAA
jgi:hypothetical protein